LDNPGTDGRIILKINMKETGWEGMNWINLTQGWDKWWAFVNTEGYENKNCTLLGYYASSGNFLPTFRDNLPVPSQVVLTR
jgi:hypothetical protein